MTASPALEMWSRQGSTYDTDGRTSTITFQRAFTVLLEASDTIEVAYSAAGLPAVSSLYPGSNYIYAKNYTVERPSPIMAIVIVNYEGETGLAADPTTGSPADIGYSIRWGTTVEDLEIDEDFNGEPLVNANDEPITGIREKFYDDVVYITRNFLGINRYALRAYRRATNSDVFLDWPPGTARLIDDESEAVFINGQIAYWRVRAAIQFREPYRTTADKAWYKRVRHEGFTERDAAGETPHIAWDKGTKSPTTTPVLLKIDGTRADSVSTAISGAHWLQFQTLGSLPFSALGLV
jgi:hypothetical protein